MRVSSFPMTRVYGLPQEGRGQRDGRADVTPQQAGQQPGQAAKQAELLRGEAWGLGAGVGVGMEQQIWAEGHLGAGEEKGPATMSSMTTTQQ